MEAQQINFSSTVKGKEETREESITDTPLEGSTNHTNNSATNNSATNNSATNNTNRTEKTFMLNNSLNIAAITHTEHQASTSGGWLKQNTDTIAGWKRDLELMAFVYTTCKERFVGYIQNILVATLAVSTVAAVLSAINVALGGSFLGTGADYKTAILALNVVVLAATGVTTGLNGLIKIYGWDISSGQYNDFVGRIGGLWTVIDSELNMPAEQRAPAADFMKRIYGQYIMLKQLAPGIASGAVKAAYLQYQNAAYDNYVWENQFAKKFQQAVEEV